MKKKIELCMVLILLLAAMLMSKKLSEMTSRELSGEETKVVVIDPGHGGEDPGKVGVNEALEKDINLQIALKLKELLTMEGITVIMTREDDYVPDRKMEDLEERVDLINRTKPDLAVCIHQNSFEDPEIWGAQVFYYKESEPSERAADILQEELRMIDPENERETKSDVSYYLLKKTKVPTVIVECGFLSNPEEAEKLVTEDYQTRISEAICSGIIKCLD